MAIDEAPLEQIASLQRAALELRRRGHEPTDMSAWLAQLAPERRNAAEAELAARRAAGTPGRGEARGVPAGAGDAQRQRAALELKLEESRVRISELAARLSLEEKARAEAEQTLALQQRQLRELKEDRRRLTEENERVERLAREQTAAAEQAAARYAQLKAGRQEVSEAALAHVETAQALQAENARLRAELEQVQQERDARLSQAAGVVEAAQADTADAVLAELWSLWVRELPEVFADTHKPTRQTFEQLGTVFLESVRVFAAIELHVRQMLKELRQLDDETFKLNHAYMMLSKTPPLQDLLREYLDTGRKKCDLFQMLRGLQAWARGLAGGLQKAIIKAPELIADELNYNKWPSKAGWTTSGDAALAKYFKETVQKTAPDKLGTLLRKLAGELAYEDYNTLVKRPR